MAEDSPSPDGDSGTFEKWLVRIFLILAFGVAFGIEGMTLVRSFLIDEEPTEQVEERDEEEIERVLQEGRDLFPETTLSERVARLSLIAQPETWQFSIAVAINNETEHPATLTFRRLETKNGRILPESVSHTWAPGDSSAFTARWNLEPGDQPVAVTLATETEEEDDGEAERFRIGRVPVQMQR